jgi:hypothetical protein
MVDSRTYVHLGEIHELFQVWCDDQGIRISDALKAMVVEVVQDDQFKFKEPQTSATIRIRLAKLHAPFALWCEKHNQTPGAALRELVKQKLLQQIDAGLKLPLIVPENFSAGHMTALVGISEMAHVRVELRLTQSEAEAITKLAEKGHASAPKLIRKLVRAYLLKAAIFSTQETTDLGAINLALMRIGNNLNQIARKLHSETTAHVDHQEIHDCMTQIDAHVKTCAQALELSRERWRIEGI